MKQCINVICWILLMGIVIVFIFASRSNNMLLAGCSVWFQYFLLFPYALYKCIFFIFCVLTIWFKQDLSSILRAIMNYLAIGKVLVLWLPPSIKSNGKTCRFLANILQHFYSLFLNNNMNNNMNICEQF